MVLLLGLTVFLVVMVGKAFCAWVCPVPWTQRFFRPRKERAEKGKPHLLNHKQMERDDTQRLSELSAEGSDAECSTELSAAEKNVRGERFLSILWMRKQRLVRAVCPVACGWCA